MLSTGTIVLGRYEVVEFLGGGGFGNAYLAKDKADSDRQVAFKESLATMGAVSPEDKIILERFRREADLLKSIDSPHVVRYITDGEHEGTFIIVMEYAGKSLNKLLVREKDGSFIPLGEKRVISIIAQALAGLSAAYKVSCVAHRDIDVSNLFLSPSGIVKVGDFGIAKIKYLPSITATGLMGKYRYMSPECFTAPKLVDWRADQYALGICFNLLLTGRYPLSDPGSDVAAAMKYATEEIPVGPAAMLLGCCSEKTNSIVIKMLAKNPSERFGSCEELLDALGGKSILKKICLNCMEIGEWEDKCCGSCGSMFDVVPKEASAFDGVLKISPEPPVLIDVTRLTARLLIIRDDGMEHSIDLHADSVSLGRKLIDPENRFVSRVHAVLERRSDGWYIKDEGSLNGTFVKASVLGEGELRRLNSEDSIRFADVAARFILE